MSLQYVIDGYNIIHHPIFTGLCNKKIKDPRSALLDLIKTKRLTGSPKNKAVIVFDGYNNLSCRMEDADEISVIFSGDQTADERINNIVKKSANPKNVFVVSDDKEIKLSAKLAGAKTKSVEEFIGPKIGRQIKEEPLKSELNLSQMFQINAELRKIWLK